jgi:alanine racemase
MLPTSRIDIDLAAFDENLAAFRALVGPSCQICPIIKADAYGLGALHIAQRIAAAGLKLVAVYSMQQAADLAAAGLPLSTLVLAPADPLSRTDVLYRMVVAGRLHLTVHSLAQLDHIESIGISFGSPIPVHVEIDTGMARVGMSPDEADEVFARIHQRRYIHLAGVMSHTASADDDPAFTQLQHDRFEQVIARNARHISPDVLIHFAGTHAALRDSRYHHRMVRVGLGLFGYGEHAMQGMTTVDAPALRPVVRWTSRVVHVSQVAAGTPVGYHGTFRTERASRLGVVPVGYADGYPLSLSNRGVVRVGAELCPVPVRGQINMDQIIIDLTDAPSAGIDSPVELISREPDAPNALPKVARLAGSNCYELLCRLSPRAQRRYTTMDRTTGRVGHVATM